MNVRTVVERLDQDCIQGWGEKKKEGAKRVEIRNGSRGTSKGTQRGAGGPGQGTQEKYDGCYDNTIQDSLPMKLNF